MKRKYKVNPPSVAMYWLGILVISLLLGSGKIEFYTKQPMKDKQQEPQQNMDLRWLHRFHCYNPWWSIMVSGIFWIIRCRYEEL